ncbi:hypothetical protein L1987_12621 [Smallanthus sonchifolius]|uniref:Uncharacterized protein n=1 Tax=Smallanthus sonchifolius TaxID=185202 RepID=A0ACB9JFU0_9ASTR|nr:hypothetical protein L1987_12621 [Smallanthus sonchifolius]
MNISRICEANVAEKKEDDNINAYNRCGSLFLQACDDDSSSSSSSKGHEVEWTDDYYDLRSPGTIKDLQGFWKQLCPLENLDFGTSCEDMSFESLYPYSYNDATSSYNFYNNDYNTIQHLI